MDFLDEVDREIIRVMQLDGRITMTGLAELVHLSQPAVSARLRKLEDAGLRLTGRDHVHGLHSPYWWVKCAVGVTNDDHPLAKAFHRVLVWDIEKRPLATRLAEQVLDPLIGKSMVLYFRKPETA